MEQHIINKRNITFHLRHFVYTIIFCTFAITLNVSILPTSFGRQLANIISPLLKPVK